MTPSPDEATWRNRFILLNLARIGGTIVVLIGLVVWQGDLLREGGAPAVGIPMVIVGLAASFGAPKWLARRWKTPPGP
ncbi:hypothetical protein [Sphingosinicella humi]|uniref:Uncharacterized protein n=1 Tax=Allosphingosinicella humi TaxID=2068657 RepID=A0A2U2J3Q2_9SPHN|nr:hypothetical protein [Sphingosinicella humi]PWG02957.1 hypothetical protein DF286_08805 [Sphingosinicella humi]